MFLDMLLLAKRGFCIILCIVYA